MPSPAVYVRKLSKMYRMYAAPSDRLKEMLLLGRHRRHREFWALRDISFEVRKGESFGIVGPNGSGKSTLLEILTGILQATSGIARASGRVAALLDLGAGFNPEFTGRENIFMNGEIMGLSRAYLEANFPRIASFAEIGDFMDQPMKTYSTGMWVRLAFSAAIHCDPDLLVVDEALSVGDAIFANRCVQKFRELKTRGVTVVLVSHDLGLVKLICDRAMLLYQGRDQAQGTPDEVVNRYNALVLDRQQAFAEQARGGAPEHERGGGLAWAYRHGDRQAEVIRAELLNERGEPVSVVRSGEVVTVRVVAHFAERHPHPVVGMMIRTRIGMEVYGTNTLLEPSCGETGPLEAGDDLEVTFQLACWLAPQEYTLTVATQSPDGTSHDWLDGVLSFQVIDVRQPAGVANLHATVRARRIAGGGVGPVEKLGTAAPLRAESETR